MATAIQKKNLDILNHFARGGTHSQLSDKLRAHLANQPDLQQRLMQQLNQSKQAAGIGPMPGASGADLRASQVGPMPGVSGAGFRAQQAAAQVGPMPGLTAADAAAAKIGPAHDTGGWAGSGADVKQAMDARADSFAKAGLKKGLNNGFVYSNPSEVGPLPQKGFQGASDFAKSAVKDNLGDTLRKTGETVGPKIQEGWDKYKQGAEDFADTRMGKGLKFGGKALGLLGLGMQLHDAYKHVSAVNADPNASKWDSLSQIAREGLDMGGTALGAAGGGALGTFAGGPVGTFVGGAAGGMLGHKAVDSMLGDSAYSHTAQGRLEAGHDDAGADAGYDKAIQANKDRQAAAAAGDRSAMNPQQRWEQELKDLQNGNTPAQKGIAGSGALSPAEAAAQINNQGGQPGQAQQPGQGQGDGGGIMGLMQQSMGAMLNHPDGVVFHKADGSVDQTRTELAQGLANRRISEAGAHIGDISANIYGHDMTHQLGMARLGYDQDKDAADRVQAYHGKFTRNMLGNSVPDEEANEGVKKQALIQGFGTAHRYDPTTGQTTYQGPAQQAIGIQGANNDQDVVNRVNSLSADDRQVQKMPAFSTIPNPPTEAYFGHNGSITAGLQQLNPFADPKMSQVVQAGNGQYGTLKQFSGGDQDTASQIAKANNYQGGFKSFRPQQF